MICECLSLLVGNKQWNVCVYEESVTVFVLFKQVQVVSGSELSRPDPLSTRFLFPTRVHMQIQTRFDGHKLLWTRS